MGVEVIYGYHLSCDLICHRKTYYFLEIRNIQEVVFENEKKEPVSTADMLQN